MAKVKSIKGETVDFDLMKIKKDIERREKNKDVALREQYVSVKRRKSSQTVGDIISQQKRLEDEMRKKIEDTKKNKPSPTKEESPKAGKRRIVKSGENKGDDDDSGESTENDESNE